MNKKFIALAVAAAAFGTSAQAVELYNKDGSTFSVGGHLTVGIDGSESQDAAVDSVSPRINMEATQDLGNGFTADAKVEFQTNMLDGGDNSFTTRLGYIGVGHEQYGRLAAGTQWSPYYAAAGIADLPIAFANDFLYDNHGALGTGRADRMVAYTNAFDFDNAGAFNFGLAWQGAGSDFTGFEAFDADGVAVPDSAVTIEADDRFQVALGYEIAGFGINYAYTGGDVSVKGFSEKEKAESHLVSANYGTYGKGVYVAAVYADNKNMNNATVSANNVGSVTSLIEDSKAYEAILAYGLSNSLNLSVNYEKVEDAQNSLTVYETSALQAEYDVTTRMRAFAGYQFDLQGEGVYKSDRDNAWIAGVRIFL